MPSEELKLDIDVNRDETIEDLEAIRDAANEAREAMERFNAVVASHREGVMTAAEANRELKGGDYL